MQIKGIVFVGTATPQREATTAFFERIFGAAPEPLEGFPADVFNFPDGSSFGVVEVPAESSTRTVGFLVEDMGAAISVLDAAGVPHGEVGENQLGRYVHITAPDGKLYELVEKPSGGRE